MAARAPRSAGSLGSVWNSRSCALWIALPTILYFGGEWLFSYASPLMYVTHHFVVAPLASVGAVIVLLLSFRHGPPTRCALAALASMTLLASVTVWSAASGRVPPWLP